MANPNIDPRIGRGRDIPDRNRDPGADLEAEGVPDSADDFTPGSGDVSEPELPSSPTDMPTASTSYGTTAWEMQHPQRLDARLAAEEPEDQPDDELGDDVADDLTDDVLEDDAEWEYGDDRDGRPAEEAAIRVEDDPWTAESEDESADE